MPKLLAFDTSTEALSIAVRHGDALFEHTGIGGAQSSSTLIPFIQQLLAEAGLALRELDAIAFGRGPGSFTGLRTACAVAQGLGYGAGKPVLPVDTLTLVAEAAREAAGATRVVAVLDARMNEVYVAKCEWTGTAWRQLRPPILCTPEAVQAEPGWVLAGNAFAMHADRLPRGPERI